MFITIFYSGLALLNFFPVSSSTGSPSKCSWPCRIVTREQLTTSFKNMRSFYRFIGMVMIISLCFWALALVGILLQARLMHPGTGTGI
ncbi:hypothetical protein ACQ86N_13445 [Puia sp. P3]|uniref:hypothetical protein n=1 Tax=Puia sp. P3 TaxID=3423952 RepID=UPI003D679C29